MTHALKLLGINACAALLLSGSAYAYAPSTGWYGGVSGDVTWLSHSDTGGGGNVALGYRFAPTNSGDFRLEGEAGYHGADGNSGHGSTHYISYMGNLYYDFTGMFSTAYNGWAIVPYIGGGIGDAEVHYGSNGNNFSQTFHHHSNDFAYQGMAGLTFVSAAAPNVDWSIGYRYFGTDSSNINANNVEIGLRYHF
jgi:opacity protein-like surface antigen